MVALPTEAENGLVLWRRCRRGRSSRRGVSVNRRKSAADDPTIFDAFMHGIGDYFVARGLWMISSLISEDRARKQAAPCCSNQTDEVGASALVQPAGLYARSSVCRWPARLGIVSPSALGADAAAVRDEAVCDRGQVLRGLTLSVEDVDRARLDVETSLPEPIGRILRMAPLPRSAGSSRAPRRRELRNTPKRLVEPRHVDSPKESHSEASGENDPVCATTMRRRSPSLRVLQGRPSRAKRRRAKALPRSRGVPQGCRTRRRVR